MIFVILAIINFCCFLLFKKNKKAVLPTIIWICLYIYVFSNRSFEIADTQPYADAYNLIGDDIYHMEKGYLFVSLFMKQLGVSFRGFLTIILIINFFVWYKCTFKILNQINLLLPLMVLMTFGGVYFYGIVIRVGIALSILYLPLTYMIVNYNRNPIISGNIGKISFSKRIFNTFSFKVILFFLLSVGISYLFHMTIIVFLPVLFLYFYPLSNKSRYIIIIISFSFFIFNNLIGAFAELAQSLLLKMGLLYGGFESVSKSIGLTNIFVAVSGAFYTYCSKYINDSYHKLQYIFVLNMYIYGILVAAMFSYIDFGARLGYMLWFFDFLLPTILLKYFKGKDKSRIFEIIIFLLFINLARLIVGVATVADWSLE